MVKCTFCGGKISEHRGRMSVKASGQIRYFCNSKCYKNFMNKRSAKKMKWTEVSREARGKA